MYSGDSINFELTRTKSTSLFLSLSFLRSVNVCSQQDRERSGKKRHKETASSNSPKALDALAATASGSHCRRAALAHSERPSY